MNRIYKSLRYFLLLVTPTLFFSCIKYEVTDSLHNGEDGLAQVPVSLTLSVAPPDMGTPETKTCQDPDFAGVTDESQIANFSVLQFDGVDGDAVLVGRSHYYDHFPLAGSETITLVPFDHPTTVVVVANTFDRIPVSTGTTLDLFLKQGFNTISSLSDVYTTYNGNDYFRLSGSACPASISSSSLVSVSLKRNVAKVVVNITNASFNQVGNDKVNITQVQLTDINAKHYYLTNVGALSPAVIFSDAYDASAPRRFDGEKRDFPATYNPEGANEGTTADPFVFYVPANLRGQTGNSAQYSKSMGAPEGATCLKLFCTYGASASPIVYTYYLGGNLTDDFNLQPNYKYTYDVTISKKGDEYFDYRVEDLAEFSFTKDANCYMIHPPKTKGMSRVFSFPIRRAAVFWNEENFNGGVYGARYFGSSPIYESLSIDGSSDWTAEILWSDFDMTNFLITDSEDDRSQDYFLQKASGRGWDPSNPNHDPLIKVKVKSGMSGNVVIGVRVRGDIVWSWHLWITDYDPDMHVTKADHVYKYAVGNGEVHRYYGGLWDTPATESVEGYADGFIMDRCLGALGPQSPDVAVTGSTGLNYQYGRKDPFIDRNQKNEGNRFYLGGITAQDRDGSGRTIDAYATGIEDRKNIRFSVVNPMMRITGGNGSDGWVDRYADDLCDGNDPNLRWHDRKFLLHTGDQNILERRKSIHDPCPAGWKVAPSSVFTWSYPVKAEDDPSGNRKEEYVSGSANSGHWHYPETFAQVETTGRIFILMQNFDSSNFRGYDGSAVNIIMSSTYMIVGSPTSRSTLSPVRCVRE